MATFEEEPALAKHFSMIAAEKYNGVSESYYAPLDEKKSRSLSGDEVGVTPPGFSCSRPSSFHFFPNNPSSSAGTIIFSAPYLPCSDAVRPARASSSAWPMEAPATEMSSAKKTTVLVMACSLEMALSIESPQHARFVVFFLKHPQFFLVNWSISTISPGLNFQFVAWTFCTTCSGLVAPAIMLATGKRAASQLKASSNKL